MNITGYPDNRPPFTDVIIDLLPPGLKLLSVRLYNSLGVHQNDKVLTDRLDAVKSIVLRSASGVKRDVVREEQISVNCARIKRSCGTLKSAVLRPYNVNAPVRWYTG
jgi:hypothetical protein